MKFDRIILITFLVLFVLAVLASCGTVNNENDLYKTVIAVERQV
jgi:hypothetical protein